MFQLRSERLWIFSACAWDSWGKRSIRLRSGWNSHYLSCCSGINFQTDVIRIPLVSAYFLRLLRFCSYMSRRRWKLEFLCKQRIIESPVALYLSIFAGFRTDCCRLNLCARNFKKINIRGIIFMTANSDANKVKWTRKQFPFNGYLQIF